MSKAKKRTGVKEKVVKGEGVDFDKLNSAMDDAIERENRYWRENDAKFRAVAQKVQSYEEFEDMVKASHIKPMTEDITQLKLGRSAWSSSGRARQRNRKNMLLVHQEDGSIATTSKDDVPPVESIADATAFHAAWKHLTSPQAKYSFLKALGGKRVYHIFKLDLDGFLFSEFIHVIDQHYAASDAVVCCKLMKAFCRTQRFSLTAQFLADDEKQKVQDIVSRVDADGGCDDNDRDRLSQGYAGFVQF